MGVIPNPKMVFIFPISCILALIFPIVIKYFPKCEGKGSFLKSKIKSLLILSHMFPVVQEMLFKEEVYTRRTDSCWDTRQVPEKDR